MRLLEIKVYAASCMGRRPAVLDGVSSSRHASNHCVARTLGIVEVRSLCLVRIRENKEVNETNVWVVNIVS